MFFFSFSKIIRWTVMQSCTQFNSKTKQPSLKINVFQRVTKSVVEQITCLWGQCFSVLWTSAVSFPSLSTEQDVTSRLGTGSFLPPTSIFACQIPCGVKASSAFQFQGEARNMQPKATWVFFSPQFCFAILPPGNFCLSSSRFTGERETTCKEKFHCNMVSLQHETSQEAFVRKSRQICIKRIRNLKH